MKINSYLRFTRQDIKGVLSLLVIILVLLAGPVLLRLLLSGGQVSLNYSDIRKAGTPDSSAKIRDPVWQHGSGMNPKRVLIPFDPNSASAEIWMQTGLAPYKGRMIVNYVKKGGHFYHAEDIRKIYSLNDSDCRMLIPLMKPDKSRQGQPNGFMFGRFRYPGYRNTRASERAMDFHGKLNLNTASYETFQKLGISSQNIRIIMRYRERNGNFTDIRELKNTGLLDIHTYIRVKPYLTL